MATTSLGRPKHRDVWAAASSLIFLWATIAFGGEPDSVFDHPDDTPYLAAGQINVVAQGHPRFAAAYSGDNSLRSSPEGRTSVVATFYSGVRLGRWTEALVDVELAGGKGLSDALGLAGFTNLDVVRNPDLGAEPYLARAMVRQIVPLGEALEDARRGPLGLATRLPEQRLELRFGKMSTVDFFDVNSVGGDSRFQFLNWAVDNDAAYDYAADTRGYSWGALVEYHRRALSLRLGQLLMPTVANGIVLDWDVIHTGGTNLELEWRYQLGGRPGILRVLGYANRARMGRYSLATAAVFAGYVSVPDVTGTRGPVRTKLGFSASLEQALNASARIFLRGGWNDGDTESFAYTEAHDSVCGGVTVSGEAWRRPFDRAGAAVASSGLSFQHALYLEQGGHGFLLGDGALTYGREVVAEGFYTAHLVRGVYAAIDVQGLWNPGYNRDRGPVLVGALRLHLEL